MLYSFERGRPRSVGTSWTRLVFRVLIAVVLTFALSVAAAHAQQSSQSAVPHLPPEQGDQGLKWTILTFAFAGVVPFGLLIRRYPVILPPLWVLMGMLPFIQTAIPHLNFALFSLSNWHGYVQGVEFSALDFLALGLYLGSRRAERVLPFRWVMLCYFSAVVLSTFQADEPTAALCYVWQLARMFLLYLVVVRLAADERFIPSLLTGMALALYLELVVVLWQRFVLHDLQPPGTLGHQNSLGMVLHFIVFPFLALLLAGYSPVISGATYASGVLIAALTASRATIGLAGAGSAMLFSVSIFRRGTQWKAAIGLVGLMGLVLLGLTAFSSLQRRFATEPLGSYDERVAYQRAASDVLSDHPFGIGANNLSHVGLEQGYYRQAGVAGAKIEERDPTFSPNVHNIYWLTAAETGYFGVGALLILLMRVVSVAFICPWRNRSDPHSELMLGLGTAVLIVCIHSAFEWITLTVEIQYVFAMTIGMIGALSQKLGYWDQVSAKRKLRRLSRLKSALLLGRTIG